MNQDLHVAISSVTLKNRIADS